MPLSASFGFFSPFHYKKKLIYQSTSLQFSSFLLSPSSFRRDLIRHLYPSSCSHY